MHCLQGLGSYRGHFTLLENHIGQDVFLPKYKKQLPERCHGLWRAERWPQTSPCDRHCRGQGQPKKRKLRLL
ncbi:unnamed protein product [Musa banksii]